MALYQSVADTIGNTPLVRIKNFEKANDLEANVYAKLEYFNPAGSVKDRIAKAIIDDAVATGKLKEGATIIEPTSGNARVDERRTQKSYESIRRRTCTYRRFSGHERRYCKG